jgi:hypothetical protein
MNEMKLPTKMECQKKLARLCDKHAAFYSLIAKRLRTEGLAEYDARLIYLGSCRLRDAIEHACAMMDKPDSEPGNLRWAMEGMERFERDYEKEARAYSRRKWGKPAKTGG